MEGLGRSRERRVFIESFNIKLDQEERLIKLAFSAQVLAIDKSVK